MNVGCVIKFDETGEVVDCLWDRRGVNHPVHHLMQRAQGLSLSRRHLQQPRRQVQNSRRRSDLHQPGLLLGRGQVISAFKRAIDAWRGRGAYAVTVPPMDGALRPNQVIEEAPVVLEVAAPDNLVHDGARLLFSSAGQVYVLETDGISAATRAIRSLRPPGHRACGSSRRRRSDRPRGREDRAARRSARRRSF